MAVVAPPRAVPEETLDRLERIWESRPGLLGWVTTTDHKRIGLLYFWTTLVLFAAGGAEALTIRTQLIQPNQHVVAPSTFDELFTMHGVTMIFFFIIPMTSGAFWNYPLPPLSPATPPRTTSSACPSPHRAQFRRPPAATRRANTSRSTPTPPASSTAPPPGPPPTKSRTAPPISKPGFGETTSSPSPPS